MAVGGVPRLGLDADAEPRGARNALLQALVPAEALRPSRGRHRDIQKKFPATLTGVAREQNLGLDAIDIWFADEARVGQKNGITRRWARRSTTPSAPQDQRYASTYIFGAVCPYEGKGAALVMPLCNTAAMNLHLAEISTMLSPGKHAVLLLDQAGWHLSGDVAVPDNITLLPLPPKCPELNVMENVGSSCAKTGSQTACSRTMTTSPVTAAAIGIASSISPGALCPSACATGLMGSDPWDLVLSGGTAPSWSERPRDN
jgi:hypothetical protein